MPQFVTLATENIFGCIKEFKPLKLPMQIPYHGRSSLKCSFWTFKCNTPEKLFDTTSMPQFSGCYTYFPPIKKWKKAQLGQKSKNLPASIKRLLTGPSGYGLSPSGENWPDIGKHEFYYYNSIELGAFSYTPSRELTLPENYTDNEKGKYKCLEDFKDILYSRMAYMAVEYALVWVPATEQLYYYKITYNWDPPVVQKIEQNWHAPNKLHQF